MASGKTTNMELNTFIESDVFDIQDFNENFNKIDALGKDYIVDQNMVGYIVPSGNNQGDIWKYRKWNSGLIEYFYTSRIYVFTTESSEWVSEGTGDHVIGMRRSRQSINIPSEIPLSTSQVEMTNLMITTERADKGGVSGLYGIFEVAPVTTTPPATIRYVDIIGFTSREYDFSGRIKCTLLGRWK